ncbi:MAG: hypothetical protein ACTS73_05895 [Arsenophonus sp. NEOnobi-MAG3]
MISEFSPLIAAIKSFAPNKLTNSIHSRPWESIHWQTACQYHKYLENELWVMPKQNRPFAPA